MIMLGHGGFVSAPDLSSQWPSLPIKIDDTGQEPDRFDDVRA
jgi:hypothetical protein